MHLLRPLSRCRVAGKEIIVVCDFGGSLEVSPGQKSGFQSQSLKAAYYLKQAGYTNVLFMKVRFSWY